MIVPRPDGSPWYEVINSRPKLLPEPEFSGSLDDWLQYTRRQLRSQVHRLHDRLRRLGASASELQDLAWTTYASNVYRENGEHDG